MLTKTDIEKYFNAEKSEGLLFIIIGITAIMLTGVFFSYLKSNWHKGASIPFIIVGLLHIVVGAKILKRSDADRKRLVYDHDMNPGDLRIKELPPMATVNKNFIIYRYTEIALPLTGLMCVFYFKQDASKSFWVGLGVALAIEAAISLSAYYFAEKRAGICTGQLNAFEQK